jgi:hypothetical protein
MQSVVKGYKTTENIRITGDESTQRFRYDYLPPYKTHSDPSCHTPNTVLPYEEGLSLDVGQVSLSVRHISLLRYKTGLG